MSQKSIICYASIIFGIIVVGISIMLIATSVHVIDTSQVGIVYYRASGRIDTSTLYIQGTHTTGPFTRFILFPVSSISEVITLDARTGDGMTFAMSVSFQYRISATIISVLSILNTWGEDGWNDAFYFTSMDNIRKVAATFDISQLVFNRTVVESSMRTSLNQAFANEQLILDNFQLLSLTFPPDFANAISSTQGVALGVLTAARQQAQTLEKLQGLIDKSVN